VRRLFISPPLPSIRTLTFAWTLLDRAAAFRLSLVYLRCADELAGLTRECSLLFAQLWAEVCAVEQLPDLGLEKVRDNPFLFRLEHPGWD
jgi:hypothetical protein